MNADRWKDVTHIYDAVMARGPHERADAVIALCGDDLDLRRNVESLLDASHERSMVLDRPVGEVAAAVMDPIPSLEPGTMVGSYRIAGLLGVGGMGEVYRARDTRLNREVAIKVLPAAVASDPERLARFKREAQVLAALNHPNIAAIYGLEELEGRGTQTPQGTCIVMELVEGPTLAERLQAAGQHHALPLDEAVAIARQIADALEAAHEQGIVHRDLKPANIKVRDDGTVKVLDFGLAKIAETSSASPPTRDASPTITSPAMTAAGVILGTAAYMSPEQAKGKPADKRSDVWSFGCVLYEMLTGRRAFDGEDMTEVLGAVVRLEPNWDALSTDVPQPVCVLLQRCLVKDRGKRIADIAAARFVLDHEAGIAATSMALPASPPRKPLWWRIATSTASALVVATLGGTLVWFATRPAPLFVTRSSVTTSGSAVFALSTAGRDITITPDGSRIVYRGNNQLLVRTLNQLEPRVLNGLGAPRDVFISPDGQWVGFVDGTTIKKVAITGGPPVVIAVIAGLAPRGATWGPDGSIIFATNISTTGLRRVSAMGGDPTVLTTPDRERGEGYHLWPQFLPGGGAVLFTITPVGGVTANAQVAVLDLRTATSKVLIRGGSDARYVPTGHLVYNVAGTLRAVAFDLRRLEVIGPPAPVLEGVATTLTGAGNFAVAASGTLVYVSGTGAIAGEQTIVSLDRLGRASPLPGLPLDAYRDVRVSPDGARLALATQDDVWIYDRTRTTLSRLTTHPASDTRPLWTPDGQRIIFRSNRAGYPELFSRPADSSGSDERLLARAKDLIDLRADAWSADGRQLLFTEVSSIFQGAIAQLAIDLPSDAKMLVKSEFYNEFPAISPDGHWMAYESNVSGRYEIYVERYPELGNRQQISTSGGRLPLWSRDGRELFYSSLDSRQMLAVPVQTGTTTLVAGRSQLLFEIAMLAPAGGSRRYDIGPDGQFVMIRNGQADGGVGTATQIVLVQNWFDELKRLVPTQ